MEHHDIIQIMKNHLISFVEKPHPAFGNLPVCPFAKKARLEGKLTYVVKELNTQPVLDIIIPWLLTESQALVIIDPRQNLVLEDFETLSAAMEKQLPEGVQMFTSHPQSDYQQNGVYTRREPYPNWQFMKNADLEKAKQQLAKSKRYKGM
jgi:hypothetical protein